MTQMAGDRRDETDSVMKLAPNLSNAPSVLYIYGLAGAGKTYVGEIIGSVAGWYVYEADDDLTPDMKKARDEKKLFTSEMRDEFFCIVADRILQLRLEHEHVVVTQATYMKQHRDYLARRIPDMDFICVTASDEIIDRHLTDRDNDIDRPYAASMRKNFQPPPEGSKIIVNNVYGKAEIVSQLTKLYG